MKNINTNTSVESKVISNEGVLESTRDFKNAILVVSLTANLFFLVAWVTLEAVSQANGQTIASLLQ